MSAQGDRTSKEFVTGRSLVKKLIGQLNGLLEIMRNPRANIENRRNAAKKLSLTQPFGYPTLVNELINSKSWQSREAAAHGVKHFLPSSKQKSAREPIHKK